MKFFVNEICIVPYEKALDKTAKGAYNISNKGCRSKRLLQIYRYFLRNTAIGRLAVFLTYYVRLLLFAAKKYQTAKSDNIHEQFKNCYKLKERYIHAITSSF